MPTREGGSKKDGGMDGFKREGKGWKCDGSHHMCVRREFLEGESHFCVHGLSCKVTCLNVSLE